MSVPAIVTAGDLRAAKAIYGESKAYLEVASRPLVAHIVSVLQAVPEVSEVWVVGNAERLEGVFDAAFRAALQKPLHIVGQFRNLFENGWQTYRRLLPDAPPEGRDPEPEDDQRDVLYLSCDVPFATAQEISVFIQRSRARGCDYAMGLVTEESMEAFYPIAPGEPGIRMAYFNTREGRFRQSNLHLVRPARVGNRHYIEEMYEHRYQREFGNILKLAWTLLTSERGGLAVVTYYALMHLGSFADRRGWRSIADRVRSWIPLERLERGVGSLLRCSFGLVITEAGGCGVDVDNAHDLDVARLRYDDWMRMQAERAEKLYGPPRLAASTPSDGESA